MDDNRHDNSDYNDVENGGKHQILGVWIWAVVVEMIGVMMLGGISVGSPAQQVNGKSSLVHHKGKSNTKKYSLMLKLRLRFTLLNKQELE